MLRRESDPHDLFSSVETSDNDCEMGASYEDLEVTCLCEASPCTLYSEAHTPTPVGAQDILLCEHCGKNKIMLTRYSEGYGTEEECLLSDPQGESDADADIEDTDSRLQEPGSLQRISSRRRKRPRVARQDTTESEDDGGRSHRTHRWNLRLSPDRTHSRTILEESISQVRPLVICQPTAEKLKTPPDVSQDSTWLVSLWPSPSSSSLLLLLSVCLSLSLVLVIFLVPWART
ncbi:uncharacterized protein si:ch211-63p21.1 [Thalassophryne amazonica]|uniref:uncharacterized protein si:ch211-63p21.1 n=1 Tax=Thalassophryne amazonica TaxID=390379 RepID=UPI00147237FA|nr:uncharacterized protein si:ch211-63p21.1 [Thalassophryne amazonica]